MRPGPIALALAVLCFLVFAQVSTHEFVDWDDGVWITENAKLASGLTPDSIWRVLASPHEGNWIPLSHLSLLLTRTLSGPQPAGFLLGNLLLHTLATLGLFLALTRMTGAPGRSASSPPLAVHPLHVESVAWASERKDVQAGLFFAGTPLRLRALRRADRLSKSRYALVLLLLAGGLLSKRPS
jgi:hypothetical protein